MPEDYSQERQGNPRTGKNFGGTPAMEPRRVSRTVGHLKVPLLLLMTAAFFGALSVRHLLIHTAYAVLFRAVVVKKAPRRGAALFSRPPRKYFIRHTS